MEHNPYATPEATLASPEDEALVNAPFYVVSVRKAVILTLVTFSLYLVYWFYRNWSRYRAVSGEKVIPVLRGIFSVFFTHTLLRNVDTVIRDKGISYPWNYSTVASVYVVIAVGGNLMSRMQPTWLDAAVIDLLSLLTVPLLAWVLAVMQRPVNVACGDETGASNASLTAANWFWIVLGTLFWVTSLFGYYLMLTGQV